MQGKNISEEIREKTRTELEQKLERHGKCAILRPTGFGKTWMLVDILKCGRYKDVLYLYPGNAVKKTVVDAYFSAGSVDPETECTIAAMREMDNVTLMSYQKLCRGGMAIIQGMTPDLVIFDEMHRIGAEKTKRMVSKLFACHPEAHFIGATATPDRSDAFDPVHVFFQDITVFEYNIHDAFRDGLLQKPYYYFCTHDTVSDGSDAIKAMREKAFVAGENPFNLTVERVFKKKLAEFADLFSMENVIRDACKKHLPDTNYMKFIIFFSSFRQMDCKMESAVSWFKNAFLEHTVETTVITSRNKAESRNIEKLDQMDRVEGKIDLICCIDMLNMGYHVDDLSGILMYRGTSSSIIYIQQLGRALSSSATHPCIVFDVVDNIHRKAVFALRERQKKQKAETPCGWHLSQDGKIIDADGDDAPLYSENGKVYSLNGDKTAFSIGQDGEIVDLSDAKDISSNMILPEDVIVTGHAAEYSEMMAKLVAETTYQRCKWAIERHLQAWCHLHEVAYPLSKAKTEELYSLNAEGFRDEFEKVITGSGLEYPMHDIGRLFGTDGISMHEFTQNVSVPQILDLLGIERSEAEKIPAITGSKKPGLFYSQSEEEAVGVTIGETLSDGMVASIPTERPRHISVCGSMLSGKTHGFAIRYVEQCINQGESIICTDRGDQLYSATAGMLEKAGYKVWHLSPWDINRSDGIDILGQAGEEHLHEFAYAVCNSRSEFFRISEMDLLEALCLYVMEKGGNLKDLCSLLYGTPYHELDSLFSSLPETHKARTMYNMAKNGPDTLRHLYTDLLEYFSRMSCQDEAICRLLSQNEINLEDAAKSKTAIFFEISGNYFYGEIAKVAVNIAFGKLMDYADRQPERKCQVPVHFLLDDLPALGFRPISELCSKMGTTNSRGISIVLFFSTIQQMKDMFGDDEAKQIIQGCHYNILLGKSSDHASCEFYSALGGEHMVPNRKRKTPRRNITTEEINRLAKNQLLVFKPGKTPVKLKKLAYK